MESADLLDDDLLEPTDTIDEAGAADPLEWQPPARMPAGTIAPPTQVPVDRDLEELRVQARMQRVAQAWDELARTLRRIVDLGELQDALGEDELIELYAQLGQVEDEALDHPALAIDAWRKVIAIDPSDLRALSALADLFAREERWDEAAEVLEKRALVVDDPHERAETLARRDAIYRHQGKWTELADSLLERSETLEDAAEQVAVLHEVAAIYERELDEAESAFYVLVAAFHRDHANAHTVHELERLAGDGERWAELADEYGKRAGELEVEDPGAAADLWLVTGRLHRDRLGNLDAAIHAVGEALRIDPAHAAARATGAELQRKQPLQRAEALAQSHDTDAAIHAYEQALAQEPTSQAALDALDRLYRRAEAWQPLVDILTRRAQLEVDDDDRMLIWREIGSICDRRLADAPRAIAAYEQVLEIAPLDDVALRALEALYDQTAQPAKYIEVLEAQLETAESDADRVSLHERLAAAWEERLGKLDRAADVYEQILALDADNGAAYRLLARLYQQTGRHDVLVETYARHVAATTDAATKLELYVAMGEVYDTKLRDRERAIEAYSDALAYDATEPHALEALGRLYEQTGEHHRAIDILTRRLRGEAEARKPELYWRIGRMQYAELGDAAAAEASLLRGLAIDPGHVPSMDELTQQYSDRGDWLKAAQMMARAETHAALPVDKVRLLLAAANIYMYKLHAAQQAKPLYAAVIAIDPEQVEAGRPLADLYFDACEWAELSPVIEMLCRKLGSGARRAEPEELGELYYRAARCAAELGDARRALAHYKAAHDLDPSHLPTLIGRADLLFDEQDWDGAGKLYQTILVEHRDAQREADVVRLYGRLGLVRRAVGDRKKALHFFEKALELDPHHRESLGAVAELHEQRGDWDAVVRAKRGLAETASRDSREKLKLLDEVATIYRERLQNAPKAAAGYLEALELAPEDRQLLQKVLDLYIETQQWRKAVEVMERFVARERDPFRRGVYFHAAATVCRDELKSLDEAIDYFACALDSFFAQPDQLDEQQLPRALMAFEAIDRLLTAKRDWKAQELAYRDMIKRLPKGDQRFFKLHVGLIDGLAEIYRSRLKQYEAAAGAFEVAQQMDPDGALRNGADRAEVLAELYVVAGADHAGKAVEQHARMLRRDPFKYDSYRALARIYKATQQYDKYWCMCNALRFLKKAEPDELQFCEQYKPRGMVKAKSALTADSWTRLAHADENRYISAIFSACWQGVAAMKAFPHKDFGIKREERRQLAGDSLLFSKLFLYLAQALNVQLPDVYLLEDDKAADIQLVNAVDKGELCPSFVVRPHLLQGKTEREVAFLLARRLTFMRPEYYLKMLLPTNTELKVVVLSAIVMVQPRFPVPPNMVAPVQQYLPALQKRMPPHALEQLGAVVQRFVQATPEINLAKWGHAVDAVAHRAGLVMSGDLDVAARAVAAESVAVDGPSVKDKVKDLVLFSISEEHFAVRAQLGLTIGG